MGRRGSGPVTGPMSGPGAEIEITQPVARPEALRMLEFIERANLELLAHEPLDVLLPKVIDLIFEAVKPDRAALLALDATLDLRVPAELMDVAIALDPQINAAVGMGFLRSNGDIYEMQAAFEDGLLTVNGAPMPIPGFR